jgi:hypothetical protein
VSPSLSWIQKRHIHLSITFTLQSFRMAMRNRDSLVGFYSLPFQAAFALRLHARGLLHSVEGSSPL